MTLITRGVKCQMKNYVKKWDNKLRMMGLVSVLNPRYFSYKHLQRGVNLILFHSVFIQSRGFKTLKSRTRRLQSTSERLAETQHIAPSFVKVIRHYFVVWKSSLLKIIKMRTFNIWLLLLVSWFYNLCNYYTSNSRECPSHVSPLAC